MSKHPPETSSNFHTERPLTAQRLAQYVARGRCERHMRYTLFPSEAKGQLARFQLEFEPLSPLLSGEGQRFEREMVEELSARGVEVRDLTNADAAHFVSEVTRQGAGRVCYYQPTLRGRVGGWACEGRADLIEVLRDGARAEATVVDFKASARETVGFRLQVAFYARLLAQSLSEAGLGGAQVQGAIVARDTTLPADGAWETFDLALYDGEIEQLVASNDSDVARAVRAGHAARYHLRAACDGCPYNALCFADTAERADLSLVPLLTASEKRALLSEGITSARALASLFEYGRKEMTTTAGKEELVRRASSRWPLAGRLPLLVQRARAAVRRLERSTEARSYILGADFGSLPDSAEHPGLVRVFIDAQRDYIQDRLYLLAARVAGPRETIEFAEMTEAAPDTDAERELLVRFVQRLLPAVARAAGADLAPLHFYTFAPRGERALLDALARHFDALCAVPAFYDLLTSSPALTQPMVSLLSEEVRVRLNLAPVCQNLYEVASALGFRWEDARTDFRRTFRARVFDNRRTFMRDAATGELRADFSKAERDDVEEDAPPPFVRVESAARFGAEIPLEYAYAAWGLLRDEGQKPDREGGRTSSTVAPGGSRDALPHGRASATARSQTRGFVGVSAEQIRDFALARVRAMQHVEESFAYKNKRVEKEPLDLSKLGEVEADPSEVPLSRSLEDFLLLEHHASFQERLLHLSLPPRERAETGRTVVLRCERYEKDDERVERAWFSFNGADGAEAVALRLRVGDWVVLNPLNDAEGRVRTGRSLVRGRLALVEELDERGAALRLLPLSFKNSPFRYRHQLFAPEAGTLYTADEMADDLNSDKFLEACRNARHNHLYHWLSDTDEGMRPRAVRPKRLRDAQQLALLAARAQQPHGLTDAQAEVIGSHLEERVLVLQGPPGTGKSHTLGFAILSRMLAQATPARPFRVAVLAKTHAAVSVALESVAKRRNQLLELAGQKPDREGGRTSPVMTDNEGDHALPHGWASDLSRLKLVKVCNDAGDSVPEGCGRVLPDGGDELTALAQWEMLLTEPLLVVGGTPGGLYRLVKQGASKGRAVDWSGEHFDLVVVDEASQMGLAEALTAAAFLRADGQFIAVGDHRQMPPILAHAWDAESRRDLKRSRVFLSVFEYLQELGFPRVALDRSFRIPEEVADFLRRHVYAADGIDFRSTNRERLAECEGLDEEWLRAVLAPEHALVVVEHDEEGSQQSNEFEAALVESIARAATEGLKLDARTGVGVVVPHRAQKALLAARLPHLADAIDTVERFQGGERELIIVSATVSDREFADSESDFLLEPRRLTVAVSRPKRKLIVVASRALFDLIPQDLDAYERGSLWKRLRHESTRTLFDGSVSGHRVTVRGL
ncbi:MAG: hypothetical protein QOH49_191 [Acidobacteriota bacterium]|jgi:hypothetical protein|nr:hypothetical protein [Acidobacteriota bacterium]